MKTFIVLLCSVLCASAAQTLIRRELFQGVGELNSSITGNFHVVNGTIYKRGGGPRVAPDTNGFSADPHQTASPSYGAFNVPAGNGFHIGQWFFLKQTAVPEGNFHYPILGYEKFGDPQWRYTVTNQSIAAGRVFGTHVSLPFDPKDQWIWLSIAVSNRGSGFWDARFYYKLRGGTLTNWYSITNDLGFVTTWDTATYGTRGAAANQTWNGRFGACSLYAIDSFADVAYPADLVEPAASYTWFLNPSSGNDTNTGLYPTEAWKTAGRVNEESRYAGMFTAPLYSLGDTLVIDTTGAPLDLRATNLTIETTGLNIKATNSPYWTNLIAITLTNAHFVKSAPANVWQIPIVDTYGVAQNHIVVWEDNKWMNHPTGAAFANVSNYLATNAGGFWTDGTTIYVHPFGSTSPTNDGKTYLRSVYRNGGSAINLNARSINCQDAYGGYTALAGKTDNDPIGAYVIQGGVSFALGGTSRVAHCYGFYGAKHIFGSTGDDSNAFLTFEDCDAEQCPPYGQSATAWVSYMASSSSTNNRHWYVNCRTRKNVGKIGSTEGATDNQSVFLSHNNGSGIQFREFVFANCNIVGAQSPSVVSNVYVTNCVFGGFAPNVQNELVIEDTLFNGIGLELLFNSHARSSTIRRVRAKHTNFLQGGVWTGWGLQGTNVTIENCTIDFSRVTSSIPGQVTGLLRRHARLENFVFRNNAVLMGTNVYSVFETFTSTDTFTIDYNRYQLTSTANFSNLYTNAGTGAMRTFGAWQGLGWDANSATNTNMGLNVGYRPLVNSPVRGAGMNGVDVGAVAYTDFGSQLRGTLRGTFR